MIVEDPKPIILTNRQRYTLMAALRFWQIEGHTAPEPLQELASSGPDNAALDRNEIADLYAKIEHGDGWIRNT